MDFCFPFYQMLTAVLMECLYFSWNTGDGAGGDEKEDIRRRHCLRAWIPKSGFSGARLYAVRYRRTKYFRLLGPDYRIDYTSEAIWEIFAHLPVSLFGKNSLFALFA